MHTNIHIHTHTYQSWISCPHVTQLLSDSVNRALLGACSRPTSGEPTHTDTSNTRATHTQHTSTQATHKQRTSTHKHHTSTTPRHTATEQHTHTSETRGWHACVRHVMYTHARASLMCLAMFPCFCVRSSCSCDCMHLAAAMCCSSPPVPTLLASMCHSPPHIATHWVLTHLPTLSHVAYSTRSTVPRSTTCISHSHVHIVV